MAGWMRMPDPGVGTLKAQTVLGQEHLDVQCKVQETRPSAHAARTTYAQLRPIFLYETGHKLDFKII